MSQQDENQISDDGSQTSDDDLQSTTNDDSAANETQSSEPKTQNPEPASIENQLADEKNKRLQLMADFQNYKKRMDTERATFGAIANMGLIQEMLEIYDDLQMAMQDPDLDLDRAKSSMQNAQSKISAAVKSAGIEPIEVKVGDEFDKTKMEAIQAVANEEMKNKVIAVISSAYRYVGQETILKAAKVIVGK